MKVNRLEASSSTKKNGESLLFQLIRSLEGSEKAYFQKLVKRHSSTGNALHTKLFALIHKSAVNDDGAFQKKLGIKTAAQYSMLKKHLLNELMDALWFLRRRTPASNSDFKFLSHIEILCEKKLYSAAEKLIKTEMASALHLQQFAKYKYLTKIQLRINSFTAPKKIVQVQDKLLQDYENANETAFVYDFLDTRFLSVVHLKNTSYSRATDHELNEVQAEMEKLKNFSFQNKAQPIFTIQKLTIEMLGNYMLGYADQSFKICPMIVEFWQEHKHLIPTHSQLYLEGVHTIFYVLFFQKEFGLVSESIKSITLLSDNLRSKEDLLKWQLLVFHTKLKLYNKTAQYHLVQSLLETEGKSILKIGKETLSLGEQLSMLTSMAISYFALEKFAEAEALIFDIKEINRVVERKDVYFFAMVFHLVVIFELRDRHRFAVAIEGAYHQLYSTKQLRPFEKSFMLFLKKQSTIIDKVERAVSITLFLKVLDEYKNDPVKKMYFLYFNYYGWLQSKLQNIPYTEYVRQQLLSDTDGHAA